MQAIVVRQFGGPEVLRLEDVPDVEPGPGQVRVSIRAVGVNPYDTYMRSGGYAVKPPLPYTPGADAAGEVDAVGSGVTGLSAGDRVYIGGTVTADAYGAYASAVLCRPDQVHPLPPKLDFAQGAGVNVPWVTAWQGLFVRGKARAGDTLLVHGASGGVGLAVVQLGRAAGLTVIGSAGSAEGLALVKAHGAHHAVNHSDPAHLDEVTALSGSRGPDVIVEMLANVNLDHDLRIVAAGGRVVVIGNRGRIEVDPRRIMAKEAVVTGMIFWNLDGGQLARAHRALFAQFESGACAPVTGVTMPLKEAPRAHELVMSPGARGKIVLIP
jgi:NADPH2:quinone reductase